MKTSFLLLETLFSFFIMSLVFFFSTLLYQNMMTSQTQEFEKTLLHADLFSTQLFIAKQLKNGVVLQNTAHQIRFYAVDNEAFLQGFYSGIIHLDESSATKISTPLSQTSQLQSIYLLFDNNELHEIKNSSENNVLYFKNPSPKTLYERYKMVSGIYEISFRNNALYFNDQLLQTQVSEFQITSWGNGIKMNICIQKLCEEWIF